METRRRRHVSKKAPVEAEDAGRCAPFAQPRKNPPSSSLLCSGASVSSSPATTTRPPRSSRRPSPSSSSRHCGGAMAPRRSARLALARRGGGGGGAVAAEMRPRRSERLRARGQGGGGAEAAEMRPRRTARLVRARRGRGGGEDRISGLPTDLLLQILLRLRCARAAARTGLVSRRWRGLWALLPEIHLRGVSPGSLDAALAWLEAARAASAPPAVLHVEASGVGISYRLVASWLLRAARLAPGELKLSVAGSRPPSAAPRAVQLPCFDCTNSIELTLRDFHFHLEPPQGRRDFIKLERLAFIAALACVC
ncbi:hypothetical protein ACP70R_029954 [Stipagrostis hirtigluma subsp. patula]